MFLFLLGKAKAFLLIFINIFRRAFCCFRRRRRLSKDEPLSHIVVNEAETKQTLQEQEQWNDWEFKNRKPASVEEHIEYYRQQQAKLRTQSTEEHEEAAEVDHFLDMTPDITKQKKLLINQLQGLDTNALNVHPNDTIPYRVSELENWEENSGWESQTLEADAFEILRQKKREERERRQLEQQQKRMERIAGNRPNLGSRLVT